LSPVHTNGMTGYVNKIIFVRYRKKIRDCSEASSGKFSQNGNMLE